MTVTAKPQLPPFPGALPKTQADWQLLLNVTQGWKRALEVPKWIAPALLNGWVQYTDINGPWKPPGFMIDVTGRVYLRGMMKNGTINTSFFQLPEGYRPRYRQLMCALSATNTGIYRVDVTADGFVIPTAQTANNFASIDGLSFSILT